MKTFMKIILFILAGAAVGGLYYVFFGCRGTCPITSNPYYTMAYFSVVAGLLSLLTIPDKKQKNP